ncbi:MULTISPECIES: GcrA family cell cycle regulator [unclassified Bradyrhizobium]|uniref:GcrA family cell cycle regulator n=1 Tax=unclassified Bradyrhizobium TaxID=2631580 RepID=UPI0029170A19|nr:MULTISPECIES: GcrA family cell cycle regulator [unclassified Bradyrhizobium]
MSVVAPPVSEASLARARREIGWTDHRVKVVRDLWNAGKTAAQIAGLIGGVTRNAVIGKVHRAVLGAADRGRPARSLERTITGQPAAPVRPVLKTDPMPKPASRPSARPSIGLVESLQSAGFAPTSDQAIPAEQRKTLAELSDECCKWPVGNPGEPGFFFCGTPKRDDGRPYCPDHMRRATVTERRPQWDSPNRSARVLSFVG